MAADQDPSADEVGFDLQDELGDDVDDDFDDEDDSELDALQAELKLHDYTDHVGSIEILTDVDNAERLAVGWKGDVPEHLRRLLNDRELSHVVIFYPVPYTQKQLAAAVVDIMNRELDAAGIDITGGVGYPNSACTAAEIHLSLEDPHSADQVRDIVAEVERTRGVPVRLHFADRIESGLDVRDN